MGNITGTAGNDVLIGSDLEADIIDGFAGADIIDRGMEDDGASGDEGNDRISGSFQDDSLLGGDGDDTLNGDSGSDWLMGNAGKDRLNGGSGWDTIFASSADEIAGDVVDGGSGIDSLEIDYSAYGTGLDITIRDWISPQVLAGGIQVTNVECFRIAGTRFDDVIIGGNYSDALLAGLGNDQLSGGRGDDRLHGGDGADALAGGDGYDYMQGDAGDDVLSGDAGGDSLYGGDGDDELHGGTGNDHLSGDAGNDLLSGGAGNDLLFESDGADILHGGAGNDSLSSGRGDDILEGGAGNDTVFETYGQGKDRITDSSGDDRFDIQWFTGDFTAKAATEVNTLDGGTTIIGFEHYSIWAIGSDANHIVTGNGNDLVNAGAGDDTSISAPATIFSIRISGRTMSSAATATTIYGSVVAVRTRPMAARERIMWRSTAVP